MTHRLSFFAPCPAGVENLLAEELRRLGVRSVRPQRSGVLFSGSVADALKVVFWTRLATRVLLTLGEVDASSAEALYEGVRVFPWEDHVRASGTLAVDAAGVNDSLRNTQFTAVKVKDAIADRFRDRYGRRPSVDVRSPDLRVNVALRSDKATVSIDLAGEPLHRRGYREQGVQVEAPMKETLAAAVLEFAGWREIAERGGAFVDPMCGSGTLAIEAALAAGDIAPGWIRPERPVSRWLGFDAEVWQRLIDDAATRREAGLLLLPPMTATDHDPRAVEIARRCVQRAGLEGVIDVRRCELSDLGAPSGVADGLVATNPPWGERLSDKQSLPGVYAELSARLRAGFRGWTLAVASPDPGLSAGLGMEVERSRTIGSGKGAATVTVFEVPAEDAVPSAHPRPGSSAGASQFAPPPDAEEFANRLGKMARHYGKWARKAGVSCYRLYDADLPNYALAIDLYQGAGPDEGRRWVHVAEYAAPHGIDSAKAAARLETAVRLVPEVLEVSPDDVFVKRRERQRGAAQYERLGADRVTGVVSEGGLLFEVNFTDYLDTGVFLDHRDTRAWLREMASGTRFLNLFAYTGTATVYAANGGAAETTTVDLSATYLSWARRNFALNGIEDSRHEFAQEDVLSWLEKSAEGHRSFDLVFCDPPTFSNSKRMEGTWDVQRDHAALITVIADVLAEKGLLVFSCNRRGFKLDVDALAAVGLAVKDATARTIPRDFERSTGIHRCWEIRHA